MSRRATIGAIGLVALGGFVSCWAAGRASLWPFQGTAPVAFQVAGPESARLASPVSLAEGFGPVVKKVLPAVVNIASSKVVRLPDQGRQVPSFSDPFFRQFFGDEFSRQFQIPKERREHSLGSGVIVNADGYVLTNNHVVEGASEIKVSLSDKRELAGRVVGADPKTDIAVVKIEGRNFPAVTLGDSSKATVGDFALAIGDPFGIGQTVTMGIISATGRGGLGIEDYEDFIQTDAAINPGNSGGALVNVHGELIGINTAIISGAGGNQGVGFAVPINMARAVMEQILKHGKVVRGSLGVMIQPVTPPMAAAFGLSGQPRGALVADVTANSAAAKSGIQKGDIILELNGAVVTDSRDLSLRISTMAPGTAVKLKVLRDGREQEVSVTLGELATKAEGSAQPGGASGGGRFGLSVDQLTPQIARQLNLPPQTPGVIITDVQPGSPAEEAGLRRGDVVQEVNRASVDSVERFTELMAKSASRPAVLGINRVGGHIFIVVEPR